MSFKKVIVSFFVLFVSLLFAQENLVAINGAVSDSLQQPISNTTLIAKPKQENIKIRYSISDSDGNYQLKLQKDISYTISISHLGYQSIEKIMLFSKNTANVNFTLVSKSESLEEVIIDYEYQAIKKNKDTITYDLKAFTNGNEFKMKDVLGKLPGVKIDENTIKLQGKTVTKLLVEGKPFFDGSTKLAIENIPADVMSKIEIISDYKESELLRNLADNEDLALNVVLKEDKKDFAFGDIEVGAGFDNFYSLHTALFKYNPKSNISFIGDINNFNNSSLSFGDLSRLIGGGSNLFKRSGLSNNLLSFASNNAERFKSTTRFSALNFQKEINEKFTVSGYAIYSNNDIVNKSVSILEYISNEPIIENREDLSDTDKNSGIFNLKFDFNPNSKQKWLYNINYLFNASNFNKSSLSNSQNTNEFITNVDGKSNNYSQNLEGYFELNKKHTMGLAINHSVANSKSMDNFFSNVPILQEFLPLNEENNYQIEQDNNVNIQNLNILVKDYWLANRFFHLIYNVGFDYKESRVRNDLSQILQNDSTLEFTELGNNNPLILSDINLGLGIKSKFGKFEFLLEAKPHFYNFKRAQVESKNLFIEPRLSIDYKIDDDTNLDFNYTFTNRYLNDLSYLENLKITGFNSALQGNPNLEDERSHNLSLYYSNYENIDDYYLDASIDYSVNNPVKNNSIIQIGINQLNTPVILNLPEENLSFNTELGLVFDKSSLDFGIDLDWLKINQVINQDVNTINSFEYGLNSKWRNKLSKSTQLNLEYQHNVYKVISEEDSRSVENIISLDFDTRFFKNFIFKTDFSTNFIKNFSDNTQNYTLQNLYLGYSKPNSKFSYSLNIRNIYNNGVIVSNNFGNNLFVTNRIFTLPRTFLFELKYKF